MDKLTFSIDTIVRVPGANLTVTRISPGATGNKEAGYFGGGEAPRDHQWIRLLIPLILQQHFLLVQI